MDWGAWIPKSGYGRADEHFKPVDARFDRFRQVRLDAHGQERERWFQVRRKHEKDFKQALKDYDGGAPAPLLALCTAGNGILESGFDEGHVGKGWAPPKP